jgi:hypothetical protein
VACRRDRNVNMFAVENLDRMRPLGRDRNMGKTITKWVNWGNDKRTCAGFICLELS